MRPPVTPLGFAFPRPPPMILSRPSSGRPPPTCLAEDGSANRRHADTTESQSNHRLAESHRPLRTSGLNRLRKVLAPPHSHRSTASPDRAMCSPREPPVHHCPGNPLLGPTDGPTAVDWTEGRRQAQATCQLALTSARLVCSSEFSRSAVSRCDVAAAAWSSPGIRRSFRVWYPSGIARTGWTTPLRR
jgi:hypothetical protein